MKIPHKVRLSNSRVATITFVVGMLVFAFVLEGQFISGGILIPRSGIRFNEGPAPTLKIAKATGAAVLYADSIAHKLQLSNANGAYANVMTDAAASIPDSALTSNVALLNRNSQDWTGSPQRLANGSAATPSLSFTNSATTGLYRAGTDILGIATAGLNAVQIDASQNVGIGQTPNASVKLVVGAGGTGANTEFLRVDGGSANGGRPAIAFARNNIDKAYLGLSGATSDQITGSASNDLIIRNVQAIDFSADAGTTLHAQLAPGKFANNTGRIITSGSTPTTSIAAGFCTTPSVAVDSGSGDDAGVIAITTGTACAAATGSVTVTFSTTNGAYGTNMPSCVVTPMDGAAWDDGVTWHLTSQSTTGFTVKFKNGATNFTSSSSYRFNYHCWGK